MTAFSFKDERIGWKEKVLPTLSYMDKFLRLVHLGEKKCCINVEKLRNASQDNGFVILDYMGRIERICLI